MSIFEMVFTRRPVREWRKARRVWACSGCNRVNIGKGDDYIFVSGGQRFCEECAATPKGGPTDV